MTPEERFWSKVDKSGECWLWMGWVSWRGYGRFYFHGRNVQAHRFAFYGDPAERQMDLDHLCRVRRCVRPSHLEPVTNRENLLRGRTLPAANLAKTVCARGHPLVSGNVYIRTGLAAGERQCLICRRAWSRQGYARHAEARREYARVRYLAIIEK